MRGSSLGEKMPPPAVAAWPKGAEAPDCGLKVGIWSCFCYCCGQEGETSHEMVMNGEEPILSDFKAHPTRPTSSAAPQDDGPWSRDRMPPTIHMVRSGSKLCETPEATTPKGSGPEGRAASHLPSTRPLPNFTGNWILVRVSGDFDSFLKEIGAPFVTRTAARAMGYGVNFMKASIVQEGDQIKIISSATKGDMVVDLRIDGTEQDSVDPDGNPVKATPTWEGQALVVAVRRIGHDAPMPLTRRYMEGAEMCVEQTMPSGLMVQRFFARR